MFIGKFNEHICLVANSVQELLDSHMVFTTIEETNEKYFLIEGQYVTEKQYIKIRKEQLHKENSDKVKEARYNKTFTVMINDQECVFDTSEETQRDLQTAALVTASGVTYPNWVTNNNITIELTAEDVQMIFQQFFGIVSPLYTIFKNYETAIDKAKTIKQLEKIVTQVVNSIKIVQA